MPGIRSRAHCRDQVRRRVAGVTPARHAALAANHQRTGDHVVQRLLALAKASHDVTDEQNHAGEIFRKMTSTGPREGYAIAVQVRYFHPEYHLAQRRLKR